MDFAELSTSPTSPHGLFSGPFHEDVRPQRVPPPKELAERVARAQKLLKGAKMDCLLCTTAPHFLYFTGMHSRFWHSPTRPFFLIIPATPGSQPIAVIPSIMTSVIIQHTWLDASNVLSWPAPCPKDDGVTLLADTIMGLPRTHGGRVGVMMGLETTVRMPLGNVDMLRAILADGGWTFSDGSVVTRELRLVKSAYETACVRAACQAASDAFDALPARLAALSISNGGPVTVREAQRCMRILLLENGADDAPWVMTQSGSGGYDNIVLEPEDRPLVAGDILVIDTGATFQGYWCDFDRNFIVGGVQHLSPNVAKTHELLWLATEAGFAAASRKGAVASDVFHAMLDVMGVDPKKFSTGRMGHGLGLELTEIFSVKGDDDTVLAPGTVMTLEPGMPVPGEPDLMIVHEENIVITENGAEWLSRRASRQMVGILCDQA